MEVLNIQDPYPSNYPLIQCHCCPYSFNASAQEGTYSGSDVMHDVTISQSGTPPVIGHWGSQARERLRKGWSLTRLLDEDYSFVQFWTSNYCVQVSFVSEKILLHLNKYNVFLCGCLTNFLQRLFTNFVNNLCSWKPFNSSNVTVIRFALKPTH